jgi:hypothetical protein
MIWIMRVEREEEVPEGGYLPPRLGKRALFSFDISLQGNIIAADRKEVHFPIPPPGERPWPKKKKKRKNQKKVFWADLGRRPKR